MKKYLTVIACLLFFVLFAGGQNKLVDSLFGALHQHPAEDTARVKILDALSLALADAGSDSALNVGQEALALSQKLRDYPNQILIYSHLGAFYQTRGEYARALEMQNSELETAAKISDSISVAWSFFEMAAVYISQSDNLKALQNYIKALGIFERHGTEANVSAVYTNIGLIYQDMRDYKMAQRYYEKALPAHEKNRNKKSHAVLLNNLGGVYLEQGQTGKALETLNRALELSESVNDLGGTALILRNRANAYVKLGMHGNALRDAHRALQLFSRMDDAGGLADLYYLLGNTQLDMHHADSAIYYATQSLSLAQKTGFYRNVYDTYDVLSKGYALKGNFAKAYFYLRKSAISKDSAMGIDKENLLAETRFDYELDKKQSQIALLTKDAELKAQQVEQQRIKTYAFLISFLLACALAGVLIFSNRRTQKTNALLQSQKTEIENALSDLKNAQAQLIQSEKMASLGQVTAGIAHEIQNPLNFVNNFSAINMELIDEFIQETEKSGKADQDALKTIRENEARVYQNGRRAENIVKGMLQHARVGGGEKRPTDINAVVDEYLKVAYNAFRLKNPDFSAILSRHFEQDLPNIIVNVQEIATVLLNIYNNAFYYLNQRRLNSQSGYRPTLEVSTQAMNRQIQILVNDNGTGIASEIIGKIFQPFFTTKPAGEGVGLGLSISYDIIKAHGGDLEVYKGDDETTIFRIVLPLR